MPELPIAIKDKTGRGTRGVLNSFRRIRNEAGKTTAGTKKMQGALSSLAGVAGVARMLVGPASIAAGFAAAGAAAAGAARDFIAFSKATAEVSTLLPKGSKEVGIMAKATKALAKQYGDMPVNQMKAAYQIISAGASTAEEATATLNAANKLAIGGVSDVTTAADGLTSVINSWGLAATDATAVSDAMFVAMRAGKTTISELSSSIGTLAPLAAQAGASVDETFAAVSALTKGGISTNVAMTGLRQVMASVVKPTNEARQMSKQLKLEFTAEALAAKGLAGFLRTVAIATKGSSDKMAQLFGGVEALVPALALTGKSAQDFEDILTDMGTKAGQTEEAFGKMMSEPEMQLKKLMSSMKVASINLGESLLQAFAPVITALNEIIEKEAEVIRLDLAEINKAQRQTGIHPDMILGGAPTGTVTDGATETTLQVIKRELIFQRTKFAVAQPDETGFRGFGSPTHPVNVKVVELPKAPAPRDAPFGGFHIMDSPLQFQKVPKDLGGLGMGREQNEKYFRAFDQMARATLQNELDTKQLALDVHKRSNAQTGDLVQAQLVIDLARHEILLAQSKEQLKAAGIEGKAIDALQNKQRGLFEWRRAEEMAAEESATTAAESAELWSDVTGALTMIDPKMAAFTSSISALASGQILTGVTGFVMALTDALIDTGDAAHYSKQGFDEANRSANALAEALFGDTLTRIQGNALKPINDFFDKLVDEGNYKGVRTFIQQMKVSGRDAQQVKDVLKDAGMRMGEFRENLYDAFGSDSVREAADRIMDVRNAMDEMSDSAKRLSEVERAAVQARFAGEAMGAQSRLQQSFKTAGSDTTLQRQAFVGYQGEIESILASMNQATTGAGSAATTPPPGNAAPSPPVVAPGGTIRPEVAVVPAVTITTVVITPEQLISLPSAQVWETFWGDNLLRVADNELSGPEASMKQIVLNMARHRDSRVIRAGDFVKLPDGNEWSSFWSNDLAKMAESDDENRGPVAVMQQIIANIAHHKHRLTILPGDFLTMPSANSWESFWSTQLHDRADSVEHGPDAVMQQIIDNIFYHKELLKFHPRWFLKMPSAASWETFWSTQLHDRADSATHGPDDVMQQIVDNVFLHRDRGFDFQTGWFLKMPSAESWETFWSQQLLARADSDVHGPDQVMQQILDNVFWHRDNVFRFQPHWFLKLPSRDNWKSFWSQGLLDRTRGLDSAGLDYGPAHAISQIASNVAKVKWNANAQDFVQLPDRSAWRSMFVRMADDIGAAIRDAMGNIPKVSIDARDFIEVRNTSAAKDIAQEKLEDLMEDFRM